MKDYIKSFGDGVVALFSVLSGIAYAVDTYYDKSADIYPDIKYVIMSIYLIAILLIGIWLVFFLFKKIKHFLGNVWRKYLHVTYQTQYASAEDLEDLYVLYMELFGTDIVPINEMADWLVRNGEIVTRVMKVGRRGPQTMIGFYDIEPLTKSGEDKLRRNKGSVKSLKATDIHTGKGSQPVAFYIGSIGCPKTSGKLDRGACILHCYKEIKRLTYGRVVTIYASPVTDEGLHLAKDVFQMVKRGRRADKKAIWSKELRIDNYDFPCRLDKIAKKMGILI